LPCTCHNRKLLLLLLLLQSPLLLVLLVLLLSQLLLLLSLLLLPPSGLFPWLQQLPWRDCTPLRALGKPHRHTRLTTRVPR
jgi:hypothetical protein